MSMFNRRGTGRTFRRGLDNRRDEVARLVSDAGKAGLEALENRVLLSDPGDTFATAEPLTLDGDGVATYDDRLPDADDIDMYTFSVSSPDFITVLADALNSGDNFDDRVDTQLTVFDYQGNEIGSSTDSGLLTGGTPIDAWFGFVPTAAHLDTDSGLYTYFVSVSAENLATNDEPGNYTFRVDGISTSVTLSGTAAETNEAGTITRPLEDIVYKVETGSDDIWESIASANAKADSAVLDTRLDVYDAEGNLIDNDSQAGRLTNAFVVFESEADQTFYVRVRSDEFEPSTPNTGAFTLGLDMIAVDIPLDPVNRYGSGDSAAGGQATDLLQFTAQASGPAIISAQGIGMIPQTDPSMTLYDADGNFIAFNDRFFGDSPQLETEVVGGETYFVLVDAFDRNNGGTLRVFVEANHTFDESIDLDDHANSGNWDNATPLVWSDWAQAEDNTLGQGPLPDHSLVSTATASGRIHRGVDTDVFVFVPPVDMLGEYAGNVGAEVDDDGDGLVDRDGDAGLDAAPIPWYETYRPATRVEIQVSPIEDPGAPDLSFLTPAVRVYDSQGTIVLDFIPDVFDDILGLDFSGSLDPARYFGDLNAALGVDYAGGEVPFEVEDGVFSLEVWGGEPYYIEVFGTGGSGRYNMFVSVDGFPDPTDTSNWSAIESDTPFIGDEFTGIADATPSYTVSGFTETTNNFNNDPIDFANSAFLSLDIANGNYTGPLGSPITPLVGNVIDSSANLERTFVMGLADYPTGWEVAAGGDISTVAGATALAGYDDDNVLGIGQFDNTGVTVLRQSGLAGIEHPLDNDIYSFRAAASGYAEIRINTTQLNDWHEEYIADGEGPLVDLSIADDFADDDDDDMDGDDGGLIGDGDPHNDDEGDDPFGNYDDGGFYLNDDGDPQGDGVEPQFFRKEKTYDSILDSLLRVFNNDFEQIALNNDNDAMIGETETTYAGLNGDYTFHKRDARVVFPIEQGEVYYFQVESGQAEAYTAAQSDPTIPVQWAHLIGSYELVITTLPTLSGDDHANFNIPGATNIGFDESGTGTVSGEIDNNTLNPLDSDTFAFTSPVNGDVTIEIAQASGSSVIPDVVIFEVVNPGGGGYQAQSRADQTANSDGTVLIDLAVDKGARYLIQVTGAGSSEGDYDVNLSGFEVEDDHADWLEVQGATEIELLDFLGSAEVEGSIEGNGDTDMFKFEVGDYTDAIIRVEGAGSFNPYVEIYETGVDPSGNPVLLRVDFNDDLSDTSVDSQVVLGLTPDRVSGITSLEYPFYYVLVRGSDIQTDEGDYTIVFDLTRTDDHPDAGQIDFATAIAIDRESGQGQDTGRIEIESDSDLFRFTALASGTSTVTVSRPSDSSFLPKLSIQDAEGNDLDTASDGTIPGSVQIDVQRGQVYYIIVEPSTLGSGDQLTGDYTLALVTPPLDDYPNAGEFSIAEPIFLDPETGDATLGTETEGDPSNPRLEVVSDTDLFTFSTIGTGNFAISMNPLDDSVIGMRPMLTIFDAEFNVVQTVTASGTGETIAVVLTDTEPNERYYILAQDAIGNRSGEYQLLLDGPTSDGGDGGGGDGGGDGGSGDDLDFDNPTDIVLDQFNADGSTNGIIAQAGERDLYTFTAPSTGTIFVQVTTPNGTLLDATVTVLDAASEQAVVTSDASGIPGVDAAVSFESAGVGTQYWVVVDGIGTGVGSYTVTIDAEPEVFRVYYPAGFTGTTINEFVSISNPNEFDVTYSVILRYETGERDQVIVSNQTLGAGSRGGVTISDGANGSPVDARIAPYSIEVQAVGGPIGAAMGHYDFGATTGDAFTDQISEAWSIARLERSPGSVADFVLYYNPHDYDVNVTLTAYDANGDEVNVTSTIGALRRGGLNLNQVTNLPTGVFGAIVTAEPVDAANAASFEGIVVAQSHYDLVNGSGFGLIADPMAGSTGGVIPNLTQSAAVDSEVVLFNPNPFVTTVSLNGQYVNAALPDLARNLTIPAGGTLRLTGTELGMIDAQALGLTYNSIYPITVMGNQTQFGDADAALGSTQAATGWFFGAAFINSQLAGESYFETLSIHNPADLTFTEVTVTLLFFDGTSESLKVDVGAESFVEVRLHETLGLEFEDNDARPANFDPNAILGRPGLNYFSVSVSAPTPVSVSFTHYDLFLQGGWTNSGAAIGPLNPLTSIV